MGDDVHHNGILMLSDAVRFLNSMNTPSGHTPTDRMPRRELTFLPDDRTFFLEHPTRADLMTLLAPNAFLGGDVRTPRLRRVVAGPATRAGRATTSVRRCSSWAAPTTPRIATGRGISTGPWCGRARRLRCIWVVGPWSHGALARRRPQARGLRLRRGGFRTLLHGAFRGAVLRLPPLDPRYGRSAAARWRSSPRATTAGMRSAAGRAPGARRMTFYLADGGRLTTEKPAARNSSTGYLSDPGRSRAIPRNSGSRGGPKSIWLPTSGSSRAAGTC